MNARDWFTILMEPTVFVVLLSATLAAVGYVANLALNLRDSRRKAIDERQTSLVKLQSLLQASWAIYKIQNMHAQELLKLVNKNQPELLMNDEVEFGFVEFPKAFPKFKQKEKELHELIRGITIHSMNPINKSLMDWLKDDIYFKAQWQREDIYGDLAAQLSQLEAHLLLWQAKYNSWITPQKPENALVYMADEDEHGVPFPSRLNEIVDKILWKADAWYNKGNAFYGQGRYDEAIKAYEKAIEINPQYAHAWNGKGKAHQELGHTTDANAAFSKAKFLGYTG